MCRKSVLIGAGSVLTVWLSLVGSCGEAIKPSANQWSTQSMPVGAYYYPEHWPEEQWERDLERMADLGFEFTHFGDFAWSRIQPQESVFDLDWLDAAIDLADRHGMKVILCTPTAAPPAWLTQKHPEILTVNATGITQQHGSRLHVSYNHPTFLRYVQKVVTRMAERYGNDPRVIGWQIDNEPHYGVLYDYSEAQQKAFVSWLRNKYGRIDDLNRAWGAVFWSQEYNSFEQIRIPNVNEAPQGSNPHAMVDFERFTADQLAESIRLQSTLLRERIGSSQFVTTNYAYYKGLRSVDLFRNRDDLDFASHTMYLTSQYLNDSGGTLGHRLGSGMELSFSQEFAESINGYTGIMELQPGQINWGKFNPQPLPGAVRMWIWHCFALGDQFLCTYRFRQPHFGNEQFHKGIMEPDGVTLSMGGEEFVEAIKELGELPIRDDAIVPFEYSRRRTSIFWDQDSFWDLEHGRLSNYWDTWQFYYTYYENLKTLGAPVQFVRRGDVLDPEEIPVLLVLACQMVDDNLIEEWNEYVRLGGHLVISSRTALKDSRGHLWEQGLQEPLWDLIGARIQFSDQLASECPGRVELDGEVYQWYAWSDVLEVVDTKDTEILSTHYDQFYEGTPVVTRRTLGKGSVTYIGAFTSSGEFERMVLREVFSRAEIEILDLPRYVFVEWNAGYWVAVNYSSSEVTINLPENAEIVLGQVGLPPAGVLVWK